MLSSPALNLRMLFVIYFKQGGLPLPSLGAKPLVNYIEFVGKCLQCNCITNKELKTIFMFTIISTNVNAVLNTAEIGSRVVYLRRIDGSIYY